MKIKWYQSIRWRAMMAIALSGVLATVTVGGLLLIAPTLREIPILGAVLGMFSDLAAVVVLITWLVLFIVFYLLLSAGTLRYIEELSRTLQLIAGGRLDTPVPIRSQDELGLLAQNIAFMTSRLRTSLEEERHAQQAKYELVTSVSHDLRTPLTSILGYLELIDSDKYRDEVELRYYVDIAYGKCQQLKRLIDQLFEFTRTSHGGIQLRQSSLDLGELLEQLAEEYVPVLQGAGMEYRLTLPADRITVSADPDMMVRVLENLITNAVRYGKEGKWVDLELQKEGSRAVIKVANYGEPIPTRELPHLFETFYRVEKSRSGHTGGSGLGLAIARNIVRLHGGNIRAYNERDRTVFEVQLPI